MFLKEKCINTSQQREHFANIVMAEDDFAARVGNIIKSEEGF